MGEFRHVLQVRELEDLITLHANVGAIVLVVGINELMVLSKSPAWNPAYWIPLSELSKSVPLTELQLGDAVE